MEKKFIVGLEEGEGLYKTKLNALNEPVIREITCEPYTAPDLEQIKREAYEKGFDAGRMLNKGKYEKGLADMYEVMKKIILDKEDGGFDTTTYCKIFGYGISFHAILKRFTASEIIAKIEEYEDGYDKGHKDAISNHDDLLLVTAAKAKDEGYKEGIQQGLTDAWNAARTIIKMDWEEKNKIFGKMILLSNIFSNYTAAKAIGKLKQYEDSKQEISVGDEVSYYGVADEHGNVNYSGVVLEIREDDYLVMEKNGKTYQLKKKLVMSKTGKHYPEMAAILEKMREGQEQ